MSSKKLPAFHLYIGDLLKDPGFLLCGWQAQNLWIRMLLHLHEMPIRGEFRSASGQPLSDQQLAKLCCMPVEECGHLLSELESNEVFSRTDGAIVNRRMVKEREQTLERDALSQVRAINGSKGGTARWQNASKTLKQNASKAEKQNDSKIDFATIAKEPIETSTYIANEKQSIAKIPTYSSSSSSSINKEKSKKPRILLSDEEWMAQLKANPIYTGIDLDHEWRKASAWYPEHHRKLTRSAFINWLIRAMDNKPLMAAPKKRILYT